jgi:hypothetical protein
MGETCRTQNEMRNAYKIPVGKPEVKRTHQRQRRRWEDNIKTNLKEIAYDVVDQSQLVHERDQWRAIVIKVMNLQVP